MKCFNQKRILYFEDSDKNENKNKLIPSTVSRIIVITLVLLISTLSISKSFSVITLDKAHADTHHVSADKCEHVFRSSAQPSAKTDERSSQLISYERLGLTAPEVEAKLRVTSASVFEKIKRLQGQTIGLQGIDGIVEFKIEFYKIYRYTDVFYDVIQNQEFLLYNKKGLLRNRTRFELKNGHFQAEFTSFQAKSNSSDSDALDISILARDEIRGKKYENIKKFLAKIPKRIGIKTKDEAVRHARELIGSQAPLVPVLFAQSDRYFLLVTPVKKSKNSPSFYLTLDKIKYQTMVGQKTSSELFEIEIEIADKLSKDSEKQAQSKIILLSSFTTYFQERYDLRPAMASKYESGLEVTGLALP